MKRFDDWPTRLDAFIQYRREDAFSWGGQDCFLFACDAILEMTGVDLASSPGEGGKTTFRGKYHDAAGALRLLKEELSASGLALTIGTFFSLTAFERAIEEVSILFAQRGDVMLVEQDGRESLGIVSLAGDTLWAPGEFALVEHPLSSAIKAWRI